MVRLIDTNALSFVPWKNGGGFTRNVAAFPEAAGFDDFIWRVSIADVAESGPFSRFPGVDRSIALLDGAGMTLAGEGDVFSLTMYFEPHDFAGEDPIRATLLDGPTRDFNLMLRRRLVQGRLTAHHGDMRISTAADHALFYCARGEYQMEDGTRVKAGWAAQLTRLTPGELFSSLTPDSVLLAALIEIQ